jgi:hypothetical protein
MDLHLPGEEPPRQTSADAVGEDAVEGVHGRLSEKYHRCHDASKLSLIAAYARAKSGKWRQSDGQVKTPRPALPGLR